MNTNPDVRDMLALERTCLANERTLLAYIRTGLSLLAAAAVLFQFFSSLHAYIAVVWILGASGIGTLIIGVIRFNQMRVKLRS